MKMSIGLFAFPDMEMLDYAGPYQAFATASSLAAAESDDEPFSLITIGSSLDPVQVRAGATLVPQATMADQLDLSCLILPGGMRGVDALIERSDVIDWIRNQAQTVPIVASVCTGAFLLAQTGLLNGLEATTHWAHTDALRRRFPAIDVVEDHRWVDAGQFVTSAGLSAGIDMALHLVERLTSRDLAVGAARRMDL